MDQINLNQKAKLFNEIFPGCETGRGICEYDKELKKKNNTLWQYQKFDPIAHLNGTLTQGRSPIIESKGAVRWISWDIDEKIDPIKFCGDIWLFDNLIFPFKSLGGRWHLYKFFSEDYDPFKANKYAKEIEKKLKAKGYAVDKGHTLPTAFNLKENKPGYWLFLPYSQDINICYSPRGNPLTFEQFAFRFKHRHHPLIAASVGLTQSETDPQNRHQGLWKIGLYLKYNETNTTIEEVNNYFTNPLEKESELRHAKNNAKYDQKHLNNNISNYLTDITGVEHEWKKIEEDPPKNFWDTDQYEDLAFNKEQKTKTPKELIGYDIAVYRELDIPKPIFIVDALIKAPSINFFFGEKGKMKTEFNFGMSNHLVRGLDFLHFICSKPYPVLYIDGEMDPYDIIEREAVYLKELGPAPKDFLHIINWNFQTDQTIPDIKDTPGQELILKYLKKQEKLTGHKPLLILDNLRSLSNYKENESDEWRPIGVWLKNLRGLGFPSQVLDHTGKSAPGPRGTSSKTDWANVCCKVEPEKSNNKNLAKVKITFDKARGLRPAQSKEFCAEYDFQGLWTLALGSAAASDNDWCSKINELLVKTNAQSVKLIKSLDMDLKKGTVTTEAYETIIKNHRPVPSQKQIAEHLGLAAGKVNRLMKKEGPYDLWCETHSEEKSNGGAE